MSASVPAALAVATANSSRKVTRNMKVAPVEKLIICGYLRKRANTAQITGLGSNERPYLHSDNELARDQNHQNRQGQVNLLVSVTPRSACAKASARINDTITIMNSKILT